MPRSVYLRMSLRRYEPIKPLTPKIKIFTSCVFPIRYEVSLYVSVTYNRFLNIKLKGVGSPRDSGRSAGMRMDRMPVKRRDIESIL